MVSGRVEWTPGRKRRETTPTGKNRIWIRFLPDYENPSTTAATMVTAAAAMSFRNRGRQKRNQRS